MPVESYHQLIAWQKATDLAEEGYRATQRFPKELYGITSQLRCEVTSVSSNIAEGQGRQSSGELRQFLGNATESLLEVESQLLFAERFHYLTHEAAEDLLGRSAETGKGLNGLMAAFQQSRCKNAGH
jgi:four helix bundle protein